MSWGGKEEEKYGFVLRKFYFKIKQAEEEKKCKKKSPDNGTAGGNLKASNMQGGKDGSTITRI